jgi:hypothetical protein
MFVMARKEFFFGINRTVGSRDGSRSTEREYAGAEVWVVSTIGVTGGDTI